MLGLRANETVPVDRLIDGLWGDDPPATAAKMVQLYVSQLRRVIAEGDARIETHGRGYELRLVEGAVDARRFERLVERASRTPAAGHGLAREALGLWRGEAMADVVGEPFAPLEVRRLEALRLRASELAVEEDLAAGDTARALAQVQPLVDQHPLREHLHALLMLSLYRAGRQAEALDAFVGVRRVLVEHAGVEPGAELRELHEAILRQDPALGALDASSPRRPARGGTHSSALVGRDRELARLEGAFDDAGAGHGRTVFIGGEAGIGKTRLATELTGQEADACVLWGRCIQLFGQGLPYLPLTDALRPLRDDGSLAALGIDLVELPRLLPERSEASRDFGEPARAYSRLRLFEEVLAVLGALAEARPVVLVLEDLHWADDSTLDLVAYLAHTARERRLLLLATYRSDEVRVGSHLDQLTRSLTTTGVAEPLALAPLDRAAVELLLASAGADTPATLLAEIAVRSEGNPLIARELLAAARRGESELPQALRDVMLAGFERSTADGRAVMRAVAAAGGAAPYWLMAAALRLERDALAAAVREAVEQDVLILERGAEMYRFRHDLLAETVYSTLLPGEREILHDRLAWALSRRSPAYAPAAEVAQHWAAAGRPVQALVASLRAARDAEAVAGLTEALRHLERVLTLWDDVVDAEELTGVALPAVLTWAAELATEGLVGPGAARGLAVSEARRLYPTVVVLESLAVRCSPPFAPAALAELRAANARFRAAVGDSRAASDADAAFHRSLTSACGVPQLVAALQPLKQALLRYEHVYMREPARIARSAAQHDAIIAALERGAHSEAAEHLYKNLAGGLADLELRPVA